MKQHWDFLVSEIKKPLYALRVSLTFAVQFLALLFLRLVLWIVFFLFPIALSLMLAFHAATNQAKKELATSYVSPSSVSPLSVTPVKSIRSTVLGLQSLNEDITFWLRELKRIKN